MRAQTPDPPEQAGQSPGQSPSAATQDAASPSSSMEAAPADEAVGLFEGPDAAFDQGPDVLFDQGPDVVFDHGADAMFGQGPDAVFDPATEDDNDSAIGRRSEAGSFLSTASLSDSVFEYRRLHGRTYQASKTTEYWAPNDDQQNEGLDIVHNAFVMIQDDQLFSAPIGDHPRRVLDVGTGTGIWAIDFADQFPAAEVTATDISPIQPTWVPPNLRFVVDDVLLDWTYPDNHFDFIHIRCMYGSVPDWPALYRKVYKHLEPGGWLQHLETDVRLQSDHVIIPENHVFNTWANFFYDAGEKMGRTFAIACDHHMREGIESAGFTNVVEMKIKMPFHGWPKDPKLQHVGYLVQVCMDQSMEGFALFVGTQVLGWSHEETTVLLAKMRSEIRKKSNCAWGTVTIVYAQKPRGAA